ncbi:hypothetical protein CANARDRAFT_203658 [[Candida] arabinofermentans NRRL YB-2248]|uniref:Phospholipid/glycerol acyltransferase domain-containing protein n=1 Tax=[Candida] arabinofermentans NRRL YB-2248 TaxID=983967 RepID=A0A1E4SUL0_9ASCO|nr:hypothetical protein CANARDRAFT_203658 [[Candida] arabinofermentans NRRL YB-2248]
MASDEPEVVSLDTKDEVVVKKSASVYQIVRLVLVITTFATGVASIIFTQMLALVFFCYLPEQKRTVLDFTKNNFVILISFITGWVTPTKMIVSIDNKTLSSNSIIQKKGKISLNLDHGAIIIANHQIYSDWLFLWFMAYLNNVGSNIYIIMKKSLAGIPLLGFGMKNYDFIFLSRKWEVDKPYMIKHFKNLCLVAKHWLLIFPEGTNLSPNTKPKSDNYIKKLGMDLKLDYVMLPRVKGLYLACKYMTPKTNTIYDFTIGFSDHTPDEYAQDIFTLGQIYLFGNGPKEARLHIKKIEISEIQEADMAIFEKWLVNLWSEKDKLMGRYYNEGGFVEDLNDQVEMVLKLNSKLDIFKVYVIPLFVAFALAGISKLISY